MSRPRAQLTLSEQIGRLSQLAEELRLQVDSLQPSLGRARLSLPDGTIEGLRHLSGTLRVLQKSVQETELELRNLQALADVGQVVNSSLNLTTVLNEVIDTIIRLTGAERAFLMLRNEREEMDIVVARNWEKESLASGEYEISRRIVAQVIADGEAVLTTNAQADPRFTGFDSVIAYNLRSIVCVPLKVKGLMTGVIYADNRVQEGLFSERERALLLAFADQAAGALENARLFDSVRRTLGEVTELKNLMEDVFASIASGVITADVQGVVTLCNQAAESILNRAPGSLLGSSLSEWLTTLGPDLESKIQSVQKEDQRFLALELNPEIDSRGRLSLVLHLTPLKAAGQATRGVAIVLDDLTEKRRLEAQRRLFERMVSPAVIDALDPDSLELGGRRAEITTLYADIRGFTSFSEALDPEILVSVLNSYLAWAARSILDEEGTIDKFLGDAVMAWFNAPIPQPDHTLRAVRAALAIREGILELHRDMPPEFQLSFGVGIHSGEALLGLIGTQERLDYTAIGDSVNTAKRLQENAAKGQILISKVAAEQVAGLVELKEVPPIQAEGKQQPIPVYEVLGLIGA
ncbi:MAG TPA: adenylate/guanylate cyclase domain-containing protein [Anaerolineales bacterium]|nr:adenylate/guanylate cyclase domain-containing protein [Anaerolineales bacterium]